MKREVGRPKRGWEVNISQSLIMCMKFMVHLMTLSVNHTLASNDRINNELEKIRKEPVMVTI